MILYGREVPKTGWVHTIFGCMFSGKTGTLIVELNVLEAGGHCVQAFRPDIDSRYGKRVVANHDGFRRDAVEIEIDNPESILTQLDPNATVIGIDEVQFFEPGILEVVCNLARVQGRVVIMSGLDTNFLQAPFGSMPSLIMSSNTTENTYALCSKCGNIATWTQRLVNGKPARRTDPIILVGARDSYEARCGDCHEILG